MNTARVRFSFTDLTYSVASLLKGVSFVGGITIRGPINNPKDIITSWPQFERIFGGLTPDTDFPLLCRRALQRGGQLRVARLGHYTDPTVASTLDATKATVVTPKILTFSAALITGNQYNLTINGTAIAQTTYATSSDATMAAIITAIKASPYVADAFLTPAGSGLVRVITILPKVALTLTVNTITGGASQAVITTTSGTAGAIVNNKNETLFSIVPKNPGSDYKNLVLVISNATNGNANYFNLAVNHTVDTYLNELFENLIIPTTLPDAAHSKYLDKVIKGDELLTFTYADISALTSPTRPVNGSYYFTGGSNGSTLVDADYIGDAAAGNGLHAFDAYDDAMQMGFPEISSTAVHTAGAAYAESRQDLQYFGHLANTNLTATTLIADRVTTTVDTKYCAFFAGGLTILDPLTSNTKQISELGDVFGIAAYSDGVSHEWFSFAGKNRGFITDALGIVNNFGTAALSGDLNLLANHQINMVVQADGKMYLSGNFSAQLDSSVMSFNNAVRLLIFQQKSLGPALKKYLEEPADLQTFKGIYNQTARPFLDMLVQQRALFSYSWDGDQNISEIENVKVNNLTDLGLGKYKVKLFEKIIPSLQEIAIEIVATPLDVKFNAL